MLIIEVATNSITAALAAQRGGADRVELCDSLEQGGTTPSAGTILKASELLDIEVFVLIRPRGGDFCYTETEIDIMEADIRFCAEAECDGVVIGSLNRDGTVNVEQNTRLLKVAKKLGLEVTFHRAIDRSRDLFESMETIIEMGFDRILTSGGYPNVMEGREVLKKMIEQAEERIVIMPGGGVNADNIGEVVEELTLTEIHGSFSNTFPSQMEHVNSTINESPEQRSIWRSDEELIRKAVENANR